MLNAPVAIVGLHLSAEIAPRRTLTRRYQVSTQGGRQPRWRGDSKELFYLSPTRNSIVGVSVDEKADSISLGTLRTLFSSDGYGATLFSTFDMTADGRRFLIA
jgi:hypothetical protein